MSKPFCVVTKSGDVVSLKTLDRYALKQKDNPSRIETDTFGQQYGNIGVVAPHYDPFMLMHLLEINTYHAKCCDLKARDVAGLGWALTSSKDPEPAEALAEQVREFFNDQKLPFTETLYRAWYDYESIGWACLEVVREGYRSDGKPVKIKHAPAQYIRVHKDGKRAVWKSGTKTVWFKLIDGGLEASDVHKDSGVITATGTIDEGNRASELIFVPNYTPGAAPYGTGDYVPAIGTIAADYARREYNRTFFDNYGVPAYAVFITGNYDPGVEDEKGVTDLEKKIREAMEGIAKNPHQTLILSLPTMGGEGDVEVQFKPLSTDVKDSSFRMYRADNREEVIVSHGVPPYRLGVMMTGQLAGNMAEEATRIYKTSVVEPRQELLEQLINKHIIRDGFGLSDYRWQLADIDLEDEKGDMELQGVLFDRGAITAAELRRHWADRFSLDPDMPMELEGDDPDLELATRSLKAISTELTAALKRNGIER